MLDFTLPPVYNFNVQILGCQIFFNWQHTNQSNLFLVSSEISSDILISAKVIQLQGHTRFFSFFIVGNKLFRREWWKKVNGCQAKAGIPKASKPI